MAKCESCSSEVSGNEIEICESCGLAICQECILTCTDCFANGCKICFETDTSGEARCQSCDEVKNG